MTILVFYMCVCVCARARAKMRVRACVCMLLVPMCALQVDHCNLPQVTLALVGLSLQCDEAPSEGTQWTHSHKKQ